MMGRALDLLERLPRSPVAVALFPVLAFWTFISLVSLADWGFGVERGLGLLVAALGLMMLPRRSEGRRSVGILLLLIALSLITLRTTQGIQAVARDERPTIDVGYTTVDAVNVLRDGENFYTTEVDPTGKVLDPEGTGFSYFAGFKYGPVMAFGFLPGVAVAGNAGYFATQLLMLLAIAAGVGWWLYRESAGTAAWGGIALSLLPVFIEPELLVGGINDVLPIALMMIAFGARAADRRIASGVLIGLSLGAKLVPAAIAIIPLFLMREQRKSFSIAAVATIGLVYAPFLVASPKEIIASLVIFNLERPIDNTSVLFFIPQSLHLVTRVIAFALSLWVLASVRPRRALGDPSSPAILTALGMTLFLLGSVAVHRNWLLGLVPFLSVGLASKVWSDSRNRSAEGPPGPGGTTEQEMDESARLST